jgi:CRP-like cAMP-binding protein
MKEKRVKKGEILQHRGSFNTKVYHVKSGLLRSYFIDEKGKEHIFMFAPEDWIIGDTVRQNEPAELFIDALEDTILVEMNKDIELINATEHNTEKLLKRMAVLQKRIIMLMSSSAIKRYEHFIETYPDITQRVPQRMIASYLGITPEALSAAKRKQFNKQ